MFMMRESRGYVEPMADLAQVAQRDFETTSRGLEKDEARVACKPFHVQ